MANMSHKKAIGGANRAHEDAIPVVFFSKQNNRYRERLVRLVRIIQQPEIYLFATNRRRAGTNVRFLACKRNHNFE